MQKRLSIFIVLALVIAVANFPMAQGFTGGSGTWKRALEVVLNFHIPLQFVYRLLRCENSKRTPICCFSHLSRLRLSSRKWHSYCKIQRHIQLRFHWTKKRKKKTFWGTKIVGAMCPWLKCKNAKFLWAWLCNEEEKPNKLNNIRWHVVRAGNAWRSVGFIDLLRLPTFTLTELWIAQD